MYLAGTTRAILDMPGTLKDLNNLKTVLKTGMTKPSGNLSTQNRRNTESHISSERQTSLDNFGRAGKNING